MRTKFGISRSGMRLWRSAPGVSLACYLIWKVGLLVFTSQSVPGGDSFFYDGPVVNLLLHGRYCNPSLAATLPISGLEVYSAYPPLYQAVLYCWMKCFGTSALAAMWMHLVLLGVITITAVNILRQIDVPAWAINFGGLFLFGLTFNDRPDNVAQMFGMLTMLAIVRGRPWVAALTLLLTFGTSFQVAGVYSVWLLTFMALEARFANRRPPWLAMLTLAVVLTGLIALVKFGYPRCWAGFREHVAITPAVTGWRVPGVSDLAKVTRILPAAFLIIATFMLRGMTLIRMESSAALRITVSGCLAVLALTCGSLILLNPLTVGLAAYFQPIIVAGFLAVADAGNRPDWKWRRWLNGLLIVALLPVSVRAVGVSTWGVLCARDISRTAAIERVNQELDDMSAGAVVFASGAHLYEVARRTNITWLHANWPLPVNAPGWLVEALERHRPAKLVLTPIDYYSEYQASLVRLQHLRPEVEVQITIPAKVPPPEANRLTGKLLQYLSWSPIIVDLSWPEKSTEQPLTP